MATEDFLFNVFCASSLLDVYLLVMLSLSFIIHIIDVSDILTKCIPIEADKSIV